MKLNYVKKIAALIVLLSTPLLVEATPVLILIGGSIESSSRGGGKSDSASKSLNGEFGTFEALSSISVPVIDPTTFPVSEGSRAVESGAFVTINSTSLRISGEVDGFRDFLFPSFDEAIFGGSATAKITFILTEPSSMGFQWFGDSFIGDPISEVSLKNSTGDIFLSCLGDSSCFDGDVFSELAQNLGRIGRVNLDAGEYEVLLNASDVIAVGQSGGGNGTFSLQVVPIPAAICLFGSGLIGLFGIRKTNQSFRSISLTCASN